MGRWRGKISLKPIKDERARRITFNKRKEGLKKKLFELSTLCDAQASMLCYGPDGRLETWPEENASVHMTIQRYNNVDEDERKKRRETVESALREKIKKVEEHVESFESPYPTWDSRFDKLSEEELKDLVQGLNTNLEKMKQRAESLNTNQSHVFFDEKGMAWIFSSECGIVPITDPLSGQQFQSVMSPPPTAQAMPLQGIQQITDFLMN